MFFFHSSHTQNLNFVGHFVANCPNCGQEQPFALSDLVQTDAIYWVPVKDTVLNRICSCEICGWAEAKPKKKVIKTSSEWKLGDSLSKLASDTGYALQNPDIEPINDKSIAALLTRIASTANSGTATVSIGAWIFGILGGVVGAFLGWLLWHLGLRISNDEAQNGMLGFLVGGLSGIIYRSKSELSRFNRIRREVELLHYVAKLGLTPADCRSAVERMGINDETVSRLTDWLATIWQEPQDEVTT